MTKRTKEILTGVTIIVVASILFRSYERFDAKLDYAVANQDSIKYEFRFHKQEDVLTDRNWDIRDSLRDLNDNLRDAKTNLIDKRLTGVENKLAISQGTSWQH